MNNTEGLFSTGLSWAAPSFLDLQLLYSDPMEILYTSELSIAEKREILSSWGSDARAVPDAPALRTLDNGQTVGIHDILDALKTLDGMELETGDTRLEDYQPHPRRDLPSQRLPTMFPRHNRDDDDDDDPPPCPAVIAPLPRFPTFGAEVELEAA